jgi:low molecular weight protein-tyrosine phosphatase
VNARTAPSPNGRVLVVCTGNLARSAYAAAVIAREWDGLFRPHLEVASAGLDADIDLPCAPGMAAVARRRGVVLDEHRSRRVDRDALLASRLVLAMTAEQRRRVQELAPAVVPRAFTLAEFAVLVEVAGVSAPVELGTVVETAHRLRPHCASASEANGVVDPVGHTLDRYIEAASRIDHLVRAATNTLTSERVPGHSRRA